MSQPAREFIVKIVEMTLWGSDFLLAHFLLVILTVPMLIPFMNSLHSTMLCMWFAFTLTELVLMVSVFVYSLASPLQADSGTPFLYEAETTETVDCYQVFDCLCRYGFDARLPRRPA